MKRCTAIILFSALQCASPQVPGPDTGLTTRKLANERIVELLRKDCKWYNADECEYYAEAAFKSNDIDTLNLWYEVEVAPHFSKCGPGYFRMKVVYDNRRFLYTSTDNRYKFRMRIEKLVLRMLEHSNNPELKEAALWLASKPLLMCSAYHTNPTMSFAVSISAAGTHSMGEVPKQSKEEQSRVLRHYVWAYRKGFKLVPNRTWPYELAQAFYIGQMQVKDEIEKEKDEYIAKFGAKPYVEEKQ